jgi:hypothetical protein
MRGGLLGAVLVLLVSLAGAAHADPPRPQANQTCLAVCVAPVEQPYPSCDHHCPEFNVCSDLIFNRDPGAEACQAKVKACKDVEWECSAGIQTAARERFICHEQKDPFPCCLDACQDTSELTPTARTWIFLDVFAAPMFRLAGGNDAVFRGYVGGEVEALIGSRWLHPGRIGFRIGPFVSGAAILGGDSPGAQLAGGLEALIHGSRNGGDVFSFAWLVRAGAVYDAPDVGANRVGGLIGVSVGFTTSGESGWKPISMWFFLETQFVPAPDGDRTNILVGIRTGPLSGLFIFAPSNL